MSEEVNKQLETDTPQVKAYSTRKYGAGRFELQLRVLGVDLGLP